MANLSFYFDKKYLTPSSRLKYWGIHHWDGILLPSAFIKNFVILGKLSVGK